MKIITVVGARPQFIKAAAVSAALKAAGAHEQLVHTGQHYDDNMSAVFFSELDISPPAFQLNVGSGPHGQQTGKMLEGVEEILMSHRPDWVLVYGDTNSTLAGALAAAKLHIPVAHVEAGLRSFNRNMPEEVNRVLTDHMSSLLFAPTEMAVHHLRSENISPDLIELSGDVMYDSALHFARRAETHSGILARLGAQSQQYCLATVHRAENTDDPDRLDTILTGLERIRRRMPVFLPLHPRTRRLLSAERLNRLEDNGVKILPPVGYLDMIALERHAAVIVTDSGGIQKEAFFYKVPCVTLREETEWVELVSLEWNRLVSPVSPSAIDEAFNNACGSRGAEGAPYGNGNAAETIVSRLMRST